MNETKRNQVKQAIQIIIEEINKQPDKTHDDDNLISILQAVKGAIIERDEVFLLQCCAVFADKHRRLREMKKRV